MDIDRNGRPSVAKLYRDYGHDWEIEPVTPGTRWIAVQRGTGDAVTIVAAHDIGALRYRMDHAQRDEPAGP